MHPTLKCGDENVRPPRMRLQVACVIWKVEFHLNLTDVQGLKQVEDLLNRRATPNLSCIGGGSLVT